MTGQHFNARATAIWGPHDANNDTKTKKILMNTMALAGGLTRGVEFITTSYDILGPILELHFDEAKADGLFDKLLRVYEQAQERHPIPLKDKKKLWDVGQMSGYILATLLEYQDDEERQAVLMSGWEDFLVMCREGTASMEELHRGMPASRNWNSDRWRIGFKNIFEAAPAANVARTSDDESSEEED